MTRYFQVTHPDGTVSKRSTANRNYPYAVRVTHDNRAIAVRRISDSLGAAAEAARHEAAIQHLVDGAELIVEISRSGDWAHYHAADPTGGEPIYVALVDPRRGDEPPTLAAAIAQLEVYRSGAADRAKSLEASGHRLAEGPEHSYSIERWSGTYTAASRAIPGFAKQFGVLATAIEVVPTVETDRKGVPFTGHLADGTRV